MSARFDLGALASSSLASGFENQTDSVLSFDAPSRTFSIDTTIPGTPYNFWVAGIQFQPNVQLQFTWPDVNGLWLIYFDGSGALAATQSTTLIGQIFGGAGAPVASFYWDATNQLILRKIDERHNVTFPGAVHSYVHTYLGTAYESGLGLADFTIAPGVANLAAHAQFSVANGVVADEDLRRIITDDDPQNLAPIANLPIFYLTGPIPGVWRAKPEDAFPVIYSGTAGYVGANGRLAYNHVIAGQWFNTEVLENDFVLVHVYASTDIDRPLFGVQGQARYSTLAAARAGALTEINTIQNLLALVSTEKRAIGTVIFQSNSGYTNAPKAKVVLTDSGTNYIDWRATPFFAGIAGAGSAAPLALHLPNGSTVVTTDLYLAPGAVQRADGVHLHEGGQSAGWFPLNADGLQSILAVTLSGLDVNSEYAATLSVRVLQRTQANNVAASSIDFSVDIYIATDGAGVASVSLQTTPSPDPSRLATTIMLAGSSLIASAGGFTIQASRHPTVPSEARAFWWVTEFFKL